MLSVCEVLLAGFSSPADQPRAAVTPDRKSTSRKSSTSEKKPRKEDKPPAALKPVEPPAATAASTAVAAAESVPENVRIIMEMGFSRQRVEQALSVLGSDSVRAEMVVQWLLEYDNTAALETDNDRETAKARADSEAKEIKSDDDGGDQGSQASGSSSDVSLIQQRCNNLLKASLPCLDWCFLPSSHVVSKCSV